MKKNHLPRFVLLTVTLSALLLSLATPAALVHRWTFDDGTGNDSIGTAHGTNFNGATVTNGQLYLDGVNDYFRTSPLAETLSNRTLMVWVTLSNLTQQAGSALTIENPTGADVFDGIIYGEAVTNRWINGSDSGSRFQSTPGIIASPTETSTEQVSIAIVYGDSAANNIKIYRNGVLYTDYTPASPRATYPAGVADILIGLRHSDLVGGSGTATGNDQYLAGSINEARIYDTALTSDEIIQAQSLNLGAAIGFNGTNQYVSVTNFGSIIPTNEVTVEFWAYSTSAAGQSAFILEPDSGGNRFQSHINYGTPPAVGLTYWDFGNISANGRISASSPANSISNWIHYALVASQTGNFMRIYTNGVLQANFAAMSPFVRGNYELRIGGGSNAPYNGRLDDFRVWNSARSRAEIQANFNQPLIGNETNLLVYYRFDSTAGNVVSNSAVATGPAFNGTLINSPAWLSPGLAGSALVVSNNLSSGPGSLRQTIGNAIPGSVIVFAPNLSGATITLTNGQLLLNKNLSIDASALPGGISINGNSSSTVFYVASGSTNVLTALTITNGVTSPAAGGGGILTYGNLTVNRCTLANNVAGGGGGIWNEGSLTVNQSTFVGNVSQTFGGGAINNGGLSIPSASLQLNQSTLASNSDGSGNGSGGIKNIGSLTINNSIVTGNSPGNITGSFTPTGNNLTSGNPLLATLGNYGGPTPTMPPVPGSPAIDGCTNGTSFTTDQRGFSRPAGMAADIGAVEFDSPALVTTLVDGGLGSLRQTITESIPGGTIGFAPNLSGATILLTNGQLVFNKNLTIDGSTLSGGIKLNGNANGRVLQVNSGNTVVLDSLTITNGLQTANFGGGIDNSGTLTLNRCTIAGNRAPNHGGGGIYNEFGAILIVNQCAFFGNIAAQGGGIRNAGILTVVNQSTFTANGNFAGGGGSIFNDFSAQLTINHSTFTGNDGGIWNDGPMNLTNSIVAGNVGFNIQNAFANAGVNLTNGNPLLAPLGNYGGPTPTMPPLPGSPALDAAVNSSFTNDQRGITRPLDGNGDSVAVADIGAVESQILVVNTAVDEFNTPSGANLSLREALRDAPTNSFVGFATNLSGSTILLTSGQLTVDKSLTVDGSTLPRGIQINGNNATRIFQVTAGSTVAMNALTIANANVGGNGGGIDNLGTLTVSRCTLVSNTASSFGGGIENNGTLTVNQSTLTANRCSGGGGAAIDNNTGSITVNHSTITSNTAASSAGSGGLWGNSITLNNSIVAGNTAPSTPNIRQAVATAGVNLTNGVPLLAPLGNYGGPTPTMPPLPGSPAIDATTNTAFATDQRGLPRLVDIALDGIPNADIGAAELQFIEGHTPVLRGTDFGQFTLRDAVTALPSGSVITFATNLGAITLTNGQLLLNKNFTIDGSMVPGGMIINGSGNSRLFEIASGKTVTLDSLSLNNGVAPGGSYPNNSGGGILNRGTLTLTNCSLISNQATQTSESGGGAIENYQGNLTINNSSFFGNTSAFVGGGIESYQGTLTLNQCTLGINYATGSGSAGGGIYSDSSVLTVNQSTISGNSAEIGGGIFCDGAATLFNSIVANNNALSGPNISGAFTASGVNMTSGDPMLGPIQNNGGLTLTLLPRPGSPVLDAAPVSGFTKDQRGFTRVVGAATDIGAVEAAFSPTVLSAKQGSRPGNGLFQITFSGPSGVSHTLFASTNLAWPINAWSNLGPALETPPGSGQFKFNDPQSDNYPQRFYRVRSP